MTEEEFTALIESIVGRPSGAIQLDDRFDEDLGADSLRMLEVIVAVDENLPPGQGIPLEIARDIRTVRSAYLAYLAAGQMPAYGNSQVDVSRKSGTV
jgi:acyl carrier protein